MKTRNRSISPTKVQTPKKVSSSPARISNNKSMEKTKAKSETPPRRRGSRSRSPARSEQKKSSSPPPSKTKNTPSKAQSASKAQSKSKSPSRSRESSVENSKNKTEQKKVARKIQERPVKEVPKVAQSKLKTSPESNSSSSSTSIQLRPRRSLNVKDSTGTFQTSTKREVKAVADVKGSRREDVKKQFDVKQMGKSILYFLYQFCSIAVIVSFVNGLVLYVHLNCNKGKSGCLLNRLPQLPDNLLTLFNTTTMARFYALFLVQVMICAIPIGKVISQHNYRYRINGLFCLLMNVAMFAAAVYLELPVTNLYTHQVEIAVAASILCLALCLIFFIKAVLSKHIKTCNNALGDFFYGAELHPRFGRYFDLKSFINLKAGKYIATLLYLSYVYTDFEAKKRESCNMSLLIACAMQISYTILNQILEKDFLVCSMLIRADKLSYFNMFHQLVMVPFVLTLPGRFLLEHEKEIVMPKYCALACFLPFILGCVFYYKCNHLKAQFKIDPNSSETCHLLSITSGRGEKDIKMICSSYFNFVRHPNYLADLLIHFSMALLTGHASAIPYLPFVYLSVYSVYRIYIMEKMLSRRSMSSYSQAWHQYTRQVPARLIAKVF